MKYRYIDIPKTASTAIRTALGRGHSKHDGAHLPASAFPDVPLLVAVVRDPLDRLVSAYSHRYRHTADVPGFRRWVSEGCRGLFVATPQVHWLDQRVELLRFDRLPGCLYDWCAGHRVQIQRPLRVLNVSTRQVTAAYYDRETELAVRSIYADDFAMWERCCGMDASISDDGVVAGLA